MEIVDLCVCALFFFISSFLSTAKHFAVICCEWKQLTQSVKWLLTVFMSSMGGIQKFVHCYFGTLKHE